MSGWTEGIPWVIAALGWGATHVFSEARERRKEVRAQLDKVLERLAEIEESAREFHAGQTFDQKKSRSLLSEISRVERSLDRIKRFKLDDFTPVIIAHRRAVTYKNFDSGSFSTCELDSELLADISFATHEFEDEIERQYGRSYPSKFPYFKLFS